MLNNTQINERFNSIIQNEIEVYERGRTVQEWNAIPDTNLIPIQDPRHWFKIKDVICVFVDMKGSTQLSANTQDKSTAGAYQLFTGTAVRLFDEFEAPYIDVRGDGVFALFDCVHPFRALAAAVTFKTFVRQKFTPKMKADVGVELGGHYGIDQKTVLVRKLGLKRHGGRSDRQNEVWAGKPVNMASKLAATADENELLVSDRFHANINHPLALRSCGCPTGQQSELWEAVDVSSDPKFDFDLAYRLKSGWCETHGSAFCDAMLKLD